MLCLTLLKTLAVRVQALMYLLAETVIPEDYLVDPVNTKRYSVDPSDSAFNYMSSLYPGRQSNGEGRLSGGGGGSSSCNHRSSQMSSGGQASTGLRRQTSSPTRSGSYLEGNRSGNKSNCLLT